MAGFYIVESYIVESVIWFYMIVKVKKVLNVCLNTNLGINKLC